MVGYWKQLLFERLLICLMWYFVVADLVGISSSCALEYTLKYIYSMKVKSCSNKNNKRFPTLLLLYMNMIVVGNDMQILRHKRDWKIFEFHL